MKVLFNTSINWYGCIHFLLVAGGWTLWWFGCLQSLGHDATVSFPKGRYQTLVSSEEGVRIGLFSRVHQWLHSLYNCSLAAARCPPVAATFGVFWIVPGKFHESTCSDSGISSNGQNIPKSMSWMKAFNIPLLDSFASHDVLLSLLHRCIMYALCFGMFRIMSVNLGPGFPSYIDKIVIDGVKKSHRAPRYGNMPSKMWPVAPSREPRSATLTPLTKHKW